MQSQTRFCTKQTRQRGRSREESVGRELYNELLMLYTLVNSSTYSTWCKYATLQVSIIIRPDLIISNVISVCMNAQISVTIRSEYNKFSTKVAIEHKHIQLS